MKVKIIINRYQNWIILANLLKISDLVSHLIRNLIHNQLILDWNVYAKKFSLNQTEQIYFIFPRNLRWNGTPLYNYSKFIIFSISITSESLRSFNSSSCSNSYFRVIFFDNTRQRQMYESFYYRLLYKTSRFFVRSGRKI